MKYATGWFAAAVVALAGGSVRADLLVGSDGKVSEGKLVSEDASEFVWQREGEATPQHLARKSVERVVKTDEHGAAVSTLTAGPAAAKRQWVVPPEPVAPPVVAMRGPSYYVIPFHGEVGSTALASVLEKSFADAVLRKATVVVLDVDSPGGMVEEAQKIFKVIHKYNKTLRIVAFTDKDLSAAAIVTLSVPHIYVKSSSVIGAATSFIPGEFDLPGKIEEKMQSAWRAAARNSAEEGGHEPLLADAMIDNDLELHLEVVGGKKLIKVGPGEKMLCRKGKVLTLSSREAVACGLADGVADDYKELGAVLGMKDWTECKGLGAMLADYLPKQAEAFNKQYGQVLFELRKNMLTAQNSDPNSGNTRSMIMLTPDMPAAFRDRAVREMHVGWYQQSLTCVAGLQKVEANMAEAMEVCAAFKQDGRVEALKSALETLGQFRAEMYDNRNKYQDQLKSAPAEATSPGTALQVVPLTRPGRTIPVVGGRVTPGVGTNRPEAHPAQDRSAAVREKVGYFPTARVVAAGVALPTSVEDAEKMLDGARAEGEARTAAFWLRDAKVEDGKRKEVIGVLTPFLAELDPYKRALFMEAYAAWAGPAEVPQLVKSLQTPERFGTALDGNERCWAPAAYALVKLDPTALSQMIPDRTSNNWWRVTVYWVVLARSKEEGSVGESAKKLIGTLTGAAVSGGGVPSGR